MRCEMKKNLKYGFSQKYNVQTEKIAGAEALIRWRKQKMAAWYRRAFIPLF